MSAMASQINGLSIGYSVVCSGADQRKHQSSASLAFVRGIHRWPVNSPHKGPATPKMFPFDDVIMFFFQEAFETLQTQGLVICHRVRPVSSYDDVLRAELREYRQYLEHQKALMVDHFRGLSGSDDYIKNVVHEVTGQVLSDLEEGPWFRTTENMNWSFQ